MEDAHQETPAQSAIETLASPEETVERLAPGKDQERADAVLGQLPGSVGDQVDGRRGGAGPVSGE